MPESRIADRLPPLRLPDLSGTTAVVTGASAGIGKATATALARAGAAVILAVRNPTKAAAVAADIKAQHPHAQVRVEEVELGSLTSIERFADRVGDGQLHLLVNNAGLSSADANEVTADGFDLQVGVNFLGAYALTCRLWPALAAGAGRVVMLGSMMATRGRITPELGRPTGSTVTSYSDSKLAAVVFAQELRRRAQAAGSSVTAVAAHPGWSQTDIFATNGPPAPITWVAKTMRWIQSPTDGAHPILLAATAVDPAPYYGPLRHGGLSGTAGPVTLPAGARVDGVGASVFESASTLTGCSLPL
jgi:NAD(P)-dependent dehydrogenase (short-subunit alcohol dehydrogenase family)